MATHEQSNQQVFDDFLLTDDDLANFVTQFRGRRFKRADKLTHFIRFENFFPFCRHALCSVG